MATLSSRRTTGCVDMHGCPISINDTITIGYSHLVFETAKWRAALADALSRGVLAAIVESSDLAGHAFCARPFADKSMCLYWDNDGDPCWDVSVCKG